VLLLAIDTATSAITVALHDGESVLAESSTLDARGHGEHLAPGIVEVLARAGRYRVVHPERQTGEDPAPLKVKARCLPTMSAGTSISVRYQ